MNIGLPRDARGREIPLDTKVLYDMCGTKVSVKEFLSRTLVESQKTGWTIKAQYEGNIDYNSFKPKNMHLSPPDSWEKLEEDLDRCIAGDNICLYCSPSGRCSDCANEPNGACDAKVLELVMERIKRLRGESDA